jgi:seryl-tRNA synthetase
MLNTSFLLENLEQSKKNLESQNSTLDIDKLIDLESRRKEIQVQTQKLQAERNNKSSEIGALYKQKEVAKADKAKEEVQQINDELEIKKKTLTSLQQEYKDFLYPLPNLTDPSVPEGEDESSNELLETYLEPTKFDFEPKDHMELGKILLGIDSDMAAKISGARFSIFMGKVAKLYRALSQFMLDTHTDNGYQEFTVPQIVHEHCLFGSGQLPKFEDDLFITENKEFYLLPTAEVALINIMGNTTIKESQLPLKMTALTSCYRKEAGSYGQDTYGLIRQHQFDKVELVQIVKQGDGLPALNEITNDAKNILQKLKLPYRMVNLCSGDIGFSAKKTYDLEVWVPSQNTYREISSCSWCGDFQSRRVLSKYKSENTKKSTFTETLNGSGLAVGRTLLAVLENYQNKDGSVRVPDVLQKYTGFDLIS